MSNKYGPEGEPGIPNPEHELDNIIQKFFQDLSSPITAALITPEQVDRLRSRMKAELEAAGIDFKVLETEQMQQALRERQFRRLTQGKGVAIAAALDHQTGLFDPATCYRTLFFRSWAQDQSSDLPGLKNQPSYTKRRGLEQLLANTIAYVAGAITSQDYLLDLKWRIGASYEKPLNCQTDKETDDSMKELLIIQLKTVTQAYAIPEQEDKARKEYTGYSRVKSESVVEFWGRLKDIASTDISTLRSHWDGLSPDEQRLLLGNDNKDSQETE